MIHRQSVLTDLSVIRGPLDPTHFPGIPAKASVHTGFRDQQAETSQLIFTEVQRLLAENNSKKVTTVRPYIAKIRCIC